MYPTDTAGVESGVYSNQLDQQWETISAETSQGRQVDYIAPSTDRSAPLEQGTLEITSIDGNSSGTAPTERIFDPRISVDSLVEQGAIVDATNQQDQSGADKSTARTKPISNISVISNTAQDGQAEEEEEEESPDFVVKADGQIVMLNNPDQTDAASIVIQVDPSGEALTTEQEQSLNGLVTYISERLMKTTVEGERVGTLEDPSNLTGPDLETSLHLVDRAATTSNTDDFSPGSDTGNQQDRVSSSGGGGGGSAGSDSGGGSGGGGSGGYSGDSNYSEDSSSSGTGSSEQNPNTTNPNETFFRSIKDVTAFMNDATGPNRYDLVSLNSSNEYEVGPYALDYQKIVGWLQGMLGDPPDLAKLEELVRKGLLSPEMFNKIKSQGFQKFVEGLQKGDMPSSDQVKEFLPKEFQELIADGIIEKLSDEFTEEGKVDGAKVALSLALGHPASEEELASNEEYLEAANQRFGIQMNESGGGSGNIDLANLEENIFFTQFAHEKYNPFGDAPSRSSNCVPASGVFAFRLLGVGPEGVDLYGNPNPVVAQVRLLMTGDPDPSKLTDISQLESVASQMGLSVGSVNNINDVNQALAAGKPVVLGGNPVAYNTGMSASDYATNKDGSIYYGGHAVTVVAQKDGIYTVCDPAYKRGILPLTEKQLLDYMGYGNGYKGIAIGKP